MENEQVLFWCNSHQREATYKNPHKKNIQGPMICDPNLGGILLPCNVVDLTGIAEIIDE